VRLEVKLGSLKLAVVIFGQQKIHLLQAQLQLADRAVLWCDLRTELLRSQARPSSPSWNKDVECRAGLHEPEAGISTLVIKVVYLVLALVPSALCVLNGCPVQEVSRLVICRFLPCHTERYLTVSIFALVALGVWTKQSIVAQALFVF